MQKVLKKDRRYSTILEKVQGHHRHYCPFPLRNKKASHADTAEDQHADYHRAVPLEIDSTSRNWNEYEHDCG